MEVGQWNRLLANRREELIKSAFREHLGIKEGNIVDILAALKVRRFLNLTI